MRLVRLCAPALLVLGGLVAASSPASAAPSCSAITQSSDGHRVGVVCYSGPGTQYRLVAQFCSTSGCVYQASSWKSYGSTASVTSGGYASGKGRIEAR